MLIANVDFHHISYLVFFRAIPYKKQVSDTSLNRMEKKYLNKTSIETLYVKQRLEISSCNDYSHSLKKKLYQIHPGK